LGRKRERERERERRMKERRSIIMENTRKYKHSRCGLKEGVTAQPSVLCGLC